MRQLVTTVLDVAGLGLVSAGAGAGVAELAGGWAGLLAAGAVVLGGSWFAGRQDEL